MISLRELDRAQMNWTLVGIGLLSLLAFNEKSREFSHLFR